MRAKVSFSSFEVRPGGSAGCWPSSAPVCRPNFWSIKSYNEDPVCSLVGFSRIWVLPYTVRISFYLTFIQHVWIQFAPYSHCEYYWNIDRSDSYIHTPPIDLIFIIDHPTRKPKESYEGAQCARPPTFRAGGPAPFICYLLYAINTLGYSPFCFRIASQILLLLF